LASTAKKKQFDYDLKELAIKGRSSLGNLITKYPVRKVSLKEAGRSTIGAIKVYIDDVSGRLNNDGRGRLMGEFDTGELMFILFKDGTYEMTELDMTRRYLLGEAKKTGRPWEIGKAFEHSAPMTDIVTVEQIGHLSSGEISLKLNGETKQNSDLNQLIWSVPEIIAHLSAIFELKAGDLIMTGTPAGVGAVKRGDVMEGHCAGIGSITAKVV
jgi:hypothetical protein